MPQPEGPAPNTVQLSPRWGYKLASQVTLKGVFGVTKAISLWPPQLTGQGESTDFAEQSGCLLAKFRCPALPCPLLTQKQPMHRDLQPARVEKYTVGKLFLFWFLEALDRPSRKLQL